MPVFFPKTIIDVPPEQLKEFLQSLVGKPRDVAIQAIMDEGFRPRVLSVDGSPIPYNSKFENTRINIDIIRGTVTKVYPG